MGILRQLAAGLAEGGHSERVAHSTRHPTMARLPADELICAGSSLVVVVGFVVEDIDRALVRHAANHALGMNVFRRQVEVLSGDCIESL